MAFSDPHSCLKSQKLYIQSAYEIADPVKLKQETESLMRTGDFFRKIVIVGDSQ